MHSEREKPRAFIDLDGVLYDIEAARHVLAAHLAYWFGVELKLAHASLLELSRQQREEQLYFNPERAAAQLLPLLRPASPAGWSEAELENQITEVLLLEYLFITESASVLRGMQQQRWTLVISTSGDASWQKDKLAMFRGLFPDLGWDMERGVIEPDKVPNLLANLQTGDVVVDDSWEVLLQIANGLRQQVEQGQRCEQDLELIRLYWLNWRFGKMISAERVPTDLPEQLRQAGIVSVSSMRQLATGLPAWRQQFEGQRERLWQVAK